MDINRVRTFPRTCSSCYLKAVYPATIPYSSSVLYSGKQVEYTIPSCPVEMCAKCQNFTFGKESYELFDKAIKEASTQPHSSPL